MVFEGRFSETMLITMVFECNFQKCAYPLYKTITFGHQKSPDSNFFFQKTLSSIFIKISRSHFLKIIVAIFYLIGFGSRLALDRFGLVWV